MLMADLTLAQRKINKQHSLTEIKTDPGLNLGIDGLDNLDPLKEKLHNRVTVYIYI